MTFPKADLPQGTLDLLILKTVALGPVHGYAIAQRLQQISNDVVQVPGGSLYPALHRLEQVIGILPAGFRFIAPDVRFFVPLALTPNFKRARHSNNYRDIARLADGGTIAQARAQVNALNVRVLDQMPEIKHRWCWTPDSTRMWRGCSPG